MSLDELKDLAREKGIKGYSKLSKDDLIRLLEINDIEVESNEEEKEEK